MSNLIAEAQKAIGMQMHDGEVLEFLEEHYPKSLARALENSVAIELLEEQSGSSQEVILSLSSSARRNPCPMMEMVKDGEVVALVSGETLYKWMNAGQKTLPHGAGVLLEVKSASGACQRGYYVRVIAAAGWEIKARWFAKDQELDAEFGIQF